MILFYIILASAFIWLGYEADWMRVRLLVGVDAPIIEQCRYVSWNNLENLARLLPQKQQPFWLKHPFIVKTIRGINNQMLGATMEPLCGWDWLKNREHIIPMYKIELITEHAKYALNTESTSVLRDCFRVYRNPYLKINLTPTRAY